MVIIVRLILLFIINCWPEFETKKPILIKFGALSYASDHQNNTSGLLVSLSCASGTNFTLGIIPQIIAASLNLGTARQQYFGILEV